MAEDRHHGILDRLRNAVLDIEPRSIIPRIENVLSIEEGITT